MREQGESYCLAILIRNLKNRDRYPDAITVADCAKTLYELYGSYEQISTMVGVHSSVIRKWVNLANAPEIIRDFVKAKKIYPVAAFAILAAFHDNEKRTEFATQVAGWGEPEIIRFIRFIKDNPSLTIEECKNSFITKVMGRIVNDDSE